MKALPLIEGGRMKAILKRPTMPNTTAFRA